MTTSSRWGRPVRALGTSLVALLVLSACSENTLTDTATASASAPTAAAKAKKERPAPINGQYIVVLDASVTDIPAVANRLARENGGELFATYRKALKGFAARGLSAQAVDRLRNHPLVRYVEQDQVMSTAGSGTQQNPPAWGIDRVDARSGLDNSYTYNASGAGVNIYIIDTGIDPSHPDFSGRATAAYDVFNDGQNGIDCNGHGTHVAGTAGSETYGVAKDANLLGVRVLDCGGSGSTAGVIEGVDWVANNAQKPASANMSLGGGFSQALNDAVENLVASGVPTSVSAGNGFFGLFSEDACTKSPASAPNALTVSITNQSDAKVSWGGFGPCVDLFAPGAGILSTIPGGGTDTYSGTSMSAPHVAGALALYLEGNPSATSAQANQAIVDNATTGAVSDREGTVDRLLYTLNFGDGTPPPPPGNNAPDADFSFSCTDLTCDFTDQSSDSDGTIASRSWAFGDGGSSSATNPTHTYGSAGSYTVTLTVTDDDGDSDSVSKTVTVDDGTPPPADDITLSTSTGKRKGRSHVDLSWTPADGGQVQVLRNGSPIATTSDDGAYRDTLGKRVRGTYTYQVCETDSGTCSNESTVRF